MRRLLCRELGAFYRDILTPIGLVLFGCLSSFLGSLSDDTALYGNLLALLSAVLAAARTVVIFNNWREERLRIAVKHKMWEEEQAAVQRERKKTERLSRNMQDILEATTGDEIAKILKRNRSEERGE